MIELTADVKEQWKKWFNVFRRLQSAAHGQNGLAIAKIYIVLDKDGTPILWTAPKVTLLEPKGKVTEDVVRQMSDIFGDDYIEALADSV